MPKKLNISDAHLKIIKTILNKYLPIHAIVWVFGSRAKGSARKYSDLDLLIDSNNKPLSSSLKGNLEDEFEESDLPYKVDIVDWNTITDEFRQMIKDERVVLYLKD